MKRDAAGKFVNNWDLETKHRVTLSLTRTAWRSLNQEAQKHRISRSELIERFARQLNTIAIADANAANSEIALLHSQIQQQQQQNLILQQQNQTLEAQLNANPDPIQRKVAIILESITDAFVAFDRNWCYTYVNQAAAQILHKNPEELLGKQVWTEVFPELVGGIAYQAMHRAVSQQVPVAWEEFGEPLQRWLEVNAYPSTEGVAVYFRDVTERKQAEAERERLLQELQNQQQWLEAVLNLMPTPTIFIEPETAKVTFANRIANELAGGDFPKNKPLDEYAATYYCTDATGNQIPPDQMPGVLIVRGERVENYELNWHTPGGIRSTLCWGEILPPMHGHPAIGIGMFQDVTQLKQIEENLRQTEERLQLALSSAQMVAWDGDLRTGQVICSPNAQELWGMQVGLAADFYAAMYPEDRDVVKQAVEQSITGDLSFSQEYRVLAPDGSWRWLKSQGRTYLNGTGQAIRMTGVTVNITERKQIEAERDRLLLQEQEARRLAENERQTQVQARQQVETLLETLQQKERQQQFLIELNDAVRAIQDSHEIIWQVACATGQHFQVTRCTYGDVDLTQDYVIVEQDYCNGVSSVVGRHQMNSFGPALITELKQGKTIVVNDVDCDPRTVGPGAEAFTAIQAKSLLCVPLVKAGRFVALLVLHHALPRNWTPDEIALLERVAEKTWLAVERSRVEAQLRESEARLQLAVKIGRMGTWDWDIQTGALFWSEGHFTVLGLPPNGCEPSYEQWARHVHPDDLAEAEAQLNLAMQEQAEYHHEYRIVWADGSVHWVEARGQFTYDVHGQPNHSIGAIIDITERKQAEQEREYLLTRERNARAQAEAAQQQLKSVFETSPVGLALLDAQQRFIAVNEALSEINGLSREQHLGASITELFGKSDPTILTIFKQIYVTGEPFISPNFPVNVPGRSDRRPGYYNLYYLPTLNSARQVEQVLVYVVDVTERIWLERTQRFLSEAGAVLASSLDYQTTLEQVARLTVPELADWCTVHIVEEDGTIDQIAVAHVDPAKLEWANQIRQKYPLDPNAERGAALTLRTGKPDFVPEIPDEMLVHAARDPEHLEILRQVGFSSFMCVPLQTQTRIIGVISFIFAESGRRYRLSDVQVAEELAYRASLAIENAQLYQIAQRDRTKAEAANRIKDEFLAVLSHELRSPLNPILGWTRMLRSKHLTPTKADQALETIERNARLQAQLIEDLLDISRILQGKMTLTIAPVNLIVTLQAALETVRLAAEAKQLYIQTTFNPVSGRIVGDANRLQQVVWNLLSNAIKFTPPGGRVHLRLDQVGHYAQIQVKDTGKGISPAFLAHVFDYFRQEDGTITRQFGGLGLGLAIVRQLTELHGGTVWAESPGANLGATFIVQIPLDLVDLEDPEPIQLSEVSADLTNIQILVVDDDADMRELASFVLSHAGAQVTTAASALEALTLLHQSKPDLLLCDIGMPQMDGYALMRQVRKWIPEQGGTIPAIALTAYAGEINQQQATAAGFQLHISKPVEPEQLIQAIVQLLRPIRTDQDD